jgi:hypothetical protein
MEAYIHGLNTIVYYNGIPMCFNGGGLGWVSTWGLGKHVHSTTYPNCHILYVHEPSYFQQI